MRHLEQVMCQRFALSLRVLFQVLRMTQKWRDPSVFQISLSGCDRTDDVSRSDSHFIQRPSSPKQLSR
jgi:hypothetical protein